MEPRTPLWLSHHWPDEYDRCIHVGRRHICRRCAVFYPVCFATMALALAGVRWPVRFDPWLLWLMSVPVVLEWWMEHLGVWRYSARRSVVTALLVAPAVGVGLARYLEHPGDRLWWAVVLTYGVICLVPMLISHRRSPAAPPPAPTATPTPRETATVPPPRAAATGAPPADAGRRPAERTTGR